MKHLVRLVISSIFLCTVNLTAFAGSVADPAVQKQINEIVTKWSLPLDGSPEDLIKTAQVIEKELRGGHAPGPKYDKKLVRFLELPRHPSEELSGFVEHEMVFALEERLNNPRTSAKTKAVAIDLLGVAAAVITPDLDLKESLVRNFALEALQKASNSHGQLNPALSALAAETMSFAETQLISQAERAISATQSTTKAEPTSKVAPTFKADPLIQEQIDEILAQWHRAPKSSLKDLLDNAKAIEKELKSGKDVSQIRDKSLARLLNLSLHQPEGTGTFIDYQLIFALEERLYDPKASEEARFKAIDLLAVVGFVIISDVITAPNFALEVLKEASRDGDQLGPTISGTAEATVKLVEIQLPKSSPGACLSSAFASLKR